MKIKKGFLLMILIITFLNIFSIVALADVDIKDKVKNQNSKIEDNIKIDPRINDEFVNNFIDNAKESDGTYKGKKIISGIKNGICIFIFKSREYIIYFYIFIMMLDVLIIAYIGSKSIEVRRKYIYRGLWTTLIFILFINMPLFVIYYQNRIDPFHVDEVISILKGLINFLSTNALVICFLVYLMGVFYQIANDNNVSNIMKCKFLKKVSIIAFLVLEFIPLALSIFI